MVQLSRERYAQLYGPTTGDRVRLADTDLWIEVDEEDVGGGIRDADLALQRPGCLADPPQPYRQFSGVCVVVGESRHMMLQRVKTSRRDDACLSHAPAQHLPDASGASDCLQRAQHE